MLSAYSWPGPENVMRRTLPYLSEYCISGGDVVGLICMLPALNRQKASSQKYKDRTLLLFKMQLYLPADLDRTAWTP
jgi:hypothetical protein